MNPINPAIVRDIILKDLQIDPIDFAERRDRKSSFARAVYAVVMRDHTGYSYADIARSIGRKNHSVVHDSYAQLCGGHYDRRAGKWLPGTMSPKVYAQWVYTRASKESQTDGGVA